MRFGPLIPLLLALVAIRPKIKTDAFALPSAPPATSSASGPVASPDRSWRQLLDVWLRDTFVMLGPDGNYYLMGTAEDEASGHCWATHAEIPLWRSPDLTNWTSLGLVWTFERDGIWENHLKSFPTNHWEYVRHDDWDRPVPPVRRAIWAPELHHVRGNYYLTAPLDWAPPDRGTFLLRSTTGRAEGTYTNVADRLLTDEIDSSLFVEDDGSVYYVWQDGRIARMRDDKTGLAEPPRRLPQTPWQPEPYREGAFLFKHDGRYHLAMTAWEFPDRTTGEFLYNVAPEGRGSYERWDYDRITPSGTGLDGRFGERYIALPGGGHNNFFRDKAGRWWATWFGEPNARKPKPFAVWRQVIVPMAHGEGRFRVETDYDRSTIALNPLFCDPVHDGAADPAVIWSPHKKRWRMFYANRRAKDADLPELVWVHGTRLGIAESADGGVKWTYLGEAQIELPPEFGGADTTDWTPEVFTDDAGTHHMLLTVVPGIFKSWDHPRHIVHLTSTNLLHWANARAIKLASDRVIDACILRLSDGSWRVWYTNEADRKSVYDGDSQGLLTWTGHGKAVGDQSGGGLTVFHWTGVSRMITDVWNGLAVHRSDDQLNWVRQPDNLLLKPGVRLDDQGKGSHPDVIVTRDRAYRFYFTPPGRLPGSNRENPVEQRRSSIQAVDLQARNGWLGAVRYQSTRVKRPAGLGNG